MRAKAITLALTAAAVLATLVLVAAGCGGDADDGSSGGSTSAAALEGTAWRLTGWSAGSQDPDDFTITAAFADGRIGGNSAVNQYGGPYTATDDGSFSVGELAGTLMAGPEPDMEAEQTYLQLLAAARAFRLDGDTLTLSDESGNESLVYTQAIPSPGT